MYINSHRFKVEFPYCSFSIFTDLKSFNFQSFNKFISPRFLYFEIWSTTAFFEVFQKSCYKSSFWYVKKISKLAWLMNVGSDVCQMCFKTHTAFENQILNIMYFFFLRICLLHVPPCSACRWQFLSHLETYPKITSSPTLKVLFWH